MKDALFAPDYRRATWICVFIAIANQMSGINILNIYSKTIFEDVKDAGGAASFSPKGCTYFIGIAGFLGAFLSNFTVKYLTRRQVFIIGHINMGICLLLVAVFTVTNHGNLVLLFMCLFVISL
jgi:predicted MFS family arabinose efflux permease